MIPTKSAEKGCFIGLMSGTSVDAVDAVLVQFTDQIPKARHHVLARHVHAMPIDLRNNLIELTKKGGLNELDRLARLDNAVARLFAEAVHTLLQEAVWKASDVIAIGSHGQTVRHVPTGDEIYTMQLGNPSLLAELTGITTVADFRRRDMAAGGQGAPLAPAFHRAFLQHPTETRAVINIGGMANITVLPPATAAAAIVTGFDTGPGNVLLDVWAHRQLGVPMDRDGAWGQRGHVIPELLTHCLRDPYFDLPPPKSTGREYFNSTWIDRQISTYKFSHLIKNEDAQATWAELTVQTIVQALQQAIYTADRVLICGGGVHNRLLMERLQTHLNPVPVESTAAHGVDPDFMEAVGFAWLARQTLHGLPGNVPSVTGAQGERVLGGVYPQGG